MESKMKNIEKIFKAKKAGGLGDILTIVFSILLWAFIVLVFALLMFTVKGCSRTEEDTILSEEGRTSEMNLFLMSYLRQPLEIDGRKTDVVELINMWIAYPKDYEDKLKEETSNLLELSKLNCPSIKISYQDQSGAVKNNRQIEIKKSECNLEGLASIAVVRGNLNAYINEYEVAVDVPLMNGMEGNAVVAMSTRYLQ